MRGDRYCGDGFIVQGNAKDRGSEWIVDQEVLMLTPKN